MCAMYYAGVGSRETPQDILNTMYKIGKYLASKGYTLRSGGAIGADTAFENGCDSVRGEKEIFYANNKKGTLLTQDVLIKAEQIASSVHPAWDRCNEYVRKLHTRNVTQVMGTDLLHPVDFLVCCTKNGKKIGGTSTAISVAEMNDIPIFNLYFESDLERLREMVF